MPYAEFLTKLTKYHHKFEEANVEVIAIARDSLKKLHEFKSKHRITIPIFGDRKGNVVKDYDVYQPAKLSDSIYLKFRLAVPTTYIVNHKGIITWAYVGNKEDRPEIDTIFQAIRENLPNYIK